MDERARQEALAHIGRSMSVQDEIAASTLDKMAATLDSQRPADGSLPLLWHWLFFQQWEPTGALSEDGHAVRGAFLPLLSGFERRVWAGGRVAFHQDLHVGERVTRHSTIANVQLKQGASGELVVVTVAHEISGSRGLAIVEAQDLIFRHRASGGAREPTVAEDLPPATHTREVRPDPVMLFRFSALTGNAHRIHFDLPFTQQVEGYPGLLVHGPLQAIWLARLLATDPSLPRVRRFSYRSERSAYCGDPLRLQMWRESSAVRLRSLDAQGGICTRAEAHFSDEAQR